jgi:hypothetical protein
VRAIEVPSKPRSKKSNIAASNDVYYSLVVGVRKGRTSPITEEMNQMKTPSRAVCV